MGCTSSAPNALSANASKEDKSIQFEEDSQETYTKHIESIDKECENRTEIKELPPSDTTESVQLIINNKSTTSLEPEKDLDISGHMIENEPSETSKTTKEEEEKDEKLSKLKLEVVGKFIGTTQDTNNDQDVEHPSIDDITEITGKDNDEADGRTETETNLNSEEHENDSEEASPTQSQSSRATRWEALADIAAELPPSLAVDPTTGQIYSLSK